MLVASVALVVAPASGSAVGGWVEANRWGGWTAILLLCVAAWWLRRGGRAWRWDRGAEGERRTAAILDQLGRAAMVLHDRRIPGGRANIDHIVITRRGVTVVETKMLAGVVRVRRRGLWHNGEAKPEMIDQVHRQVAAVERVVDHLVGDVTVDGVMVDGVIVDGVMVDGVMVDGLIVVHGASIRRGLFRRKRVAGLAVVSPEELASALRRGRHAARGRRLSRRQRGRLGASLRASLPPAG
ncbi:MAG: nuclease-related domain-containing protein [Acidimicrobiales bacterium]